MKQPFSYQVLPCSCWVTSVTNGLLHLFGKKNEKLNLSYRLLHTVLTDEGVYDRNWEIILNTVATICGFDFVHYKGELVKTKLKEVDFKSSIVICDIQSAAHSILIIQKEKDWYHAFDPDWDQINRNESRKNEFEILPDVPKYNSGKVNVKISEGHLLKDRATKNACFAMGAESSRNITVITKKVNE